MAAMNTSAGLLDLLNGAIAREMQVSIQYMLQHATWNAAQADNAGKKVSPKQSKFAASHSFLGLSGPNLKKIAITEMKHAEAIAERIAQLGGVPTTKPSPVTLGKAAEEIIKIDKAAEDEAIQLYSEIIDMTESTGDGTTARLFNKIIADEKKHLEIFSSLLENA